MTSRKINNATWTVAGIIAVVAFVLYFFGIRESIFLAVPIIGLVIGVVETLRNKSRFVLEHRLGMALTAASGCILTFLIYVFY